MRQIPRIAAFVFVLGGATSSFAATILLGPSAYLSSADSLPEATIEDFEDGLLNTAGITASGGVIGGCPSRTCDSVDGDDGAIDGSGNAGHSWYANEASITFTFDEMTLGSLPIRAGLVWTDIGFGGSFSSAFTFEAFGPGDVSLGSIGPITLGDGSDAGGTAEDRFFGVFNSAGVSAIRLTNVDQGDFAPGDWELDHVQYSFVPEPSPVPEPSSALLLALGLAGLGVSRSRKA